jgi:hypothetical protein
VLLFQLSKISSKKNYLETKKKSNNNIKEKKYRVFKRNGKQMKFHTRENNVEPQKNLILFVHSHSVLIINYGSKRYLHLIMPVC